MAVRGVLEVGRRYASRSCSAGTAAAIQAFAGLRRTLPRIFLPAARPKTAGKKKKFAVHVRVTGDRMSNHGFVVWYSAVATESFSPKSAGTRLYPRKGIAVAESRVVQRVRIRESEEEIAPATAS